MHEMSIVESLRDAVRRHLPPGYRLVRAMVDVGSLEHLDPVLMQTAWAALATDPPLAGAELVLERVDVRARCGGCGTEYEPEDPAWLACPACGVARPEILRGGGVVLESLEAEREAP